MQVLLLLTLTTQQQPASPPPPPPAPAKTSVELTGTVLMNGFYNSARTNNSDVPVFADTDAIGVKGAAAPCGPAGLVYRLVLIGGHGKSVMSDE